MCVVFVLQMGTKVRRDS